MQKSSLMAEISSIQRHLTESKNNECKAGPIPENEEPNHSVHFIVPVVPIFNFIVPTA